MYGVDPSLAFRISYAFQHLHDGDPIALRDVTTSCLLVTVRRVQFVESEKLVSKVMKYHARTSQSVDCQTHYVPTRGARFHRAAPDSRDGLARLAISEGDQGGSVDERL